MDLNQKYACPPYFLMTSHLEELHAALTPLVGKTLQILASAHPSELTDPGSALPATLWFSRILVLYNDISVILGKKDCRDELLPQEFFNFLSGFPASPQSDSDLSEDNTIKSSSPPPPLLPPHLELQPIRPPSPPHVAEHKVSLDAAHPTLGIENKGAPAAEESVIIPTPNPPPSPKRETASPVVHSAPPGSRERKARAEARDLLYATKTRHVIAILEQLGLAPIRQRGSHIVYEHPETKAQTVVPNHPSIKRGTLQSIFNQVTSKKK
jgi:predicted RNA binding protein YcfA (HicA-like mRNA interferase family)